jgi:FkbM family methyltransferase
MRGETATSLDPGGFNALASCRWGPMLYNRNDRYIGRSLAKYGEYSWLEQELFRGFVEPGTTVVDAGASIGAHAVPLSRLAGPGGLVHAFEPQRLVFQALCANLALNQCETVHAHHAALGATAGTALVSDPDPNLQNNFGGVSLGEIDAAEPVRVLALDALDLPACDFLKVDVEGMEAEVLRGAARTIARHRPVLYVENDREEKSAALIALVAGMGYELYWHLPPLFNPANFAGDTEDIFAGIVSANMLCVPAGRSAAAAGLKRVASPADRP